MDRARAAVQNFTSKRGHTTEVDELVQPGITRESVKPMRHEETTQAVDREIHQHHHHTTVQPINHQEVLPEKHAHLQHDVEQREFMHGDPEEHRRRLAEHASLFKDSSTTHETRHSASEAPVVEGEHVHHHVHEIVQPIVHKETIQPEVVHTTHPVHEVHHHHATHHGMSALPMKTLDEFKSAGGVLTGNKGTHHTHETYEGDPRPYNKDLETTYEKLGLGHHSHSHNDSGLGGEVNGSNERNLEQNSARDLERNSGRDTGRDTAHDSGLGTSSSTGTAKPSLMNRLNPLKDTDGDGKKGVMS